MRGQTEARLRLKAMARHVITQTLHCASRLKYSYVLRCSVLLIAGSLERRFSNTNKGAEISSTYATNTDPDGRAVYGVGLKPPDCWDYGFESR